MNEHVVLRVRGTASGYDTDFYAWSLRQAELIRRGALDQIDAENIAEEVESLARKERHSVEKRLRTLIEHLLKLSFFTLSDDPRRGWQVTVAKSRANLVSSFRDSPSLYSEREAIYLSEWQAAVRIASLAIADDPAAVAALANLRDEPSFSIDLALDPDFFPGG